MKSFVWLRETAKLVLETQCPLCQRSTSREFCKECQRQIERCQLAKEQPFKVGELPVFAWGSYSGALKRAIAALKYNNNPQLARPLGQWLAKSWLSACPSLTDAIIVPIPMHASKEQQRGFNQADLLARSFSKFTRLRLEIRGLRRSQETTAQFSLSATERQQNLAEAFSLGKAFQNRPPSNPVLLIDDIYTTGATARSAAQTLERQGIRVQGIVVVARSLKEK
jgi:ComF family protein